MNRTSGTLIGLMVVTTTLLPAKADPPPEGLKALLGREVIGRDRTTRETRDFVAGRIPRVPETKSAAEWTRTADKLRDDVLTRVVFRGEAARWRDAPCRVEWFEELDAGPGYRIKKLRFEAVPGLWVPALLYEPDALRGRAPVVLDLNGHEAEGKAVKHKQIRCANLAKRGVVALSPDWFLTGQLNSSGFRHGLINAIDLCGTSGVALHFLGMRRALDVLLAHPKADPTRVGVTGLSGGGWQTIVFSALEPRVTLANPVAGYSSFLTRVDHTSDLGDSEQTPADLATVADYTHLTALLAPRPFLLTYNATDDCCFAAPHALPPLVSTATPLYSLFGATDRFRTHVNKVPGTHNYEQENREAFYRMIADHWSNAGETFDPKEIPCTDEILSADRLKVPLPSDNLDFEKIGVALSRKLPREQGLAKPEQVARLREIVRPLSGEARETEVGTQDDKGYHARFCTLRVADAWTVPAVELTNRGRKPEGVVLLLADLGRAGAAPVAAKLLAEGKRVVAIDPFDFGESKIAERGYLWALLVGTVGSRPLGLQAGEVMATARWARRTFGSAPQVVSVGPRTGVVALTAAALEPDAIAGLELHDPLGSLKPLVEQGRDFAYAPELFCFGLLESFDVAQLAALVAPRPVRRVAPGDRATSGPSPSGTPVARPLRVGRSSG